MSDENKTCSSLSSQLSSADRRSGSSGPFIQNFANFSPPSVVEPFFARLGKFHFYTLPNAP